MISLKGMKIRIIEDFSSATTEARRHGVVKGKQLSI